MPISEKQVEEYTPSQGFGARVMGDESKNLLRALADEAGQFYTLEEVVATTGQKKAEASKKLWVMAKRAKKPYVKLGTYDGKTVYAITENGVAKIA